MRTWLRSVVDAILGKTSRLDAATSMAMDADFSDRREPAREGLPTFVRMPVPKGTPRARSA
jgi:hypothetical protein